MRRENQSASLLKLFAVALTGLVGALIVFKSFPDFRRYARIRRM